MKEYLHKLVDAVVAGNDEDTALNFSSFIENKSKELMGTANIDPVVEPTENE